METINFRNDIAGINTLWVIRFGGFFPHPYGEEKSKPEFDILFPSPINKDKWMVVDLKKNKNDLQTIERFQRLCEEAKQRTQDRSAMISDLGHKSEESGHDAENLAQLLIYFNEIMKKLRKKNTEEPEI